MRAAVCVPARQIDLHHSPVWCWRQMVWGRSMILCLFAGGLQVESKHAGAADVDQDAILI